MLEHLYPRSSMATRLRSTPLGAYVDGFAEVLSNQGYSPDVLREKLSAVGKLGRWLSERKIPISSLDEHYLDEFLGQTRSGPFHAAAEQILEHLRQLGVVARLPLEPDRRPPILRKFEEYLARERGIKPRSIRYQLDVAQQFLIERFGSDGVFACGKLCTADVTHFIERHAYAHKPATCQTMFSVLRSFLRFLYVRGETPTDLTGCVLRVAGWRLAALPTFLPPDQVEAVIRGVDGSVPSGRRDRAILLLLARLGLRSGEVVNLVLEDINWEMGTISVKGKSAQHNCLPLPWDVGEAVADYLIHERPTCTWRNVFLRAIAPYGPMRAPGVLTCMVARRFRRVGLQPPKMGARVLRHSLASRMLQDGNTLDEIRDILGHESHATTEIYAKVAITGLRELALPWPGAKP